MNTLIYIQYSNESTSIHHSFRINCKHVSENELSVSIVMRLSDNNMLIEMNKKM